MYSNSCEPPNAFKFEMYRNNFWHADSTSQKTHCFSPCKNQWVNAFGEILADLDAREKCLDLKALSVAKVILIQWQVKEI